MWLAITLAAGVLLGQSDTAVATPVKLKWEPSLEQALTAAKERTVPLLVCFNMDNEPANDQMVQQHYNDPEIAALGEKMVCLIASAFRHAETGGVCSRFGSVSCQEHMDAEIAARQRFIGSDTVKAPQHVFVSPTGKVILRKVFLIAPQELRKAMNKALSLVSPGLSDAALLAEDARRRGELLTLVQAPNVATRAEAIMELAGLEDDEARGVVRKLTGPDQDDVVRLAAIQAMGRAGNVGALPHLVALLSDKKVLIRKQAVTAMEQLDLPDVVPPLLKHLPKEGSDRVVAQALRTIAQGDPKNAKVVETLLKHVRHKKTALQLNALYALGRIRENPKVVDAVAKLLGPESPGPVRGMAAWTLGKLKAESAKAALFKLESWEKSAQVRQVCRAALEQIGGTYRGEYDQLASIFLTDLVEE
jgi:HEAT repeat protein